MNNQTYVYCKPVNRIAFWGPRQEAGWKRPILFLSSLLLAGGFAYLTWSLRGDPNYAYFPLLSVLLAVLGLLGLLVSLNGCNACVARLVGEA